MSEQISVVAIITPNADKVDEVRTGLSDLAEQVKANEPGVLRYKLTEQKKDGTSVFVMIEEYKDQAAWDAHVATDYFKALGETAKNNNLLAKPFEIMQLKAVGGYDSK